eukprot:scaffold11571_cov122-Cylindrotheca_fusiformis.AAC.6
MATDIVDKELQTRRKNRWETAFSNAAPPALKFGHDNRQLARKVRLNKTHTALTNRCTSN